MENPSFADDFPMGKLCMGLIFFGGGQRLHVLDINLFVAETETSWFIFPA